MHISLIVFLLGFNIAISPTFLAAAETEQPMIINGHALETVTPGKSMKDVLAARHEIMRSLMIMIDTTFQSLGGIPLDLITDKSNDTEANMTLFNSALNISLNGIQDPAATAIGLEKMHFYQSLPDCLAKNFLMNFMNISPTPAGFDRQALLLKASSAKHATSGKNNTIAAQYLWRAGWARPLLSKTWDELSEQEQTDVQDLSDCGSVPFQYLGAYYLFKEATLNVAEKMLGLATFPTTTGRDFWRIIEFDFLSGVYGERELEDAVTGWTNFINATTAEELPLMQKLAFKPIENSRDSNTWPKGYKTALYSLTNVPEESLLVDVLKVLAERIKTVGIADLYLKTFLCESTARNPENNAERILEINRICAITPGAKQIIADAICLFNQPLFATEISLDLDLHTPAERLQKLYELSNQGIGRASSYLAIAYASSLLKETTAPLVRHLGIPTYESLPEEERTLGNLTEIHKNNTVELMRLAFKGNRLAQYFLLKRPENGRYSIIEKLFDNRMVLGNTPCQADQSTMNRMLEKMLDYAFNVANILHAQNKVPEFFYDHVLERPDSLSSLISVP